MPETHPFIPADSTGKWYLNNNLHLGIPQPTADWFVNEESFAFMPSTYVKSLFLGTFPTYEVVNLVRAGGNTEFFYGQRANRFWPLLQQLTGLMTVTEVNQFQFLQETKFGLTDILRKIERIGQGSADSNLTPLVFNNILNLKQNFQAIERIYCTSGGRGAINPIGPVNAARWLLIALINVGCTVIGFNVPGYQKDITVLINNVIVWEFKLFILFSPSNQASAGLQGQVNNSTVLQGLVANLPAVFVATGNPMKLRIAQWSYLLSLGGFPLVPSLQTYVNTNRTALSTQFN